MGRELKQAEAHFKKTLRTKAKDEGLLLRIREERDDEVNYSVDTRDG